jgi:hypothetical protein
MRIDLLAVLERFRRYRAATAPATGWAPEPTPPFGRPTTPIAPRASQAAFLRTLRA